MTTSARVERNSRGSRGRPGKIDALFRRDAKLHHTEALEALSATRPRHVVAARGRGRLDAHPQLHRLACLHDEATPLFRETKARPLGKRVVENGDA